jgi:RNA polymerase sigma-70 factor (ECF subfamily)
MTPNESGPQYGAVRSAETDRDLVMRLQRGDQQALEQLYDRYAKTVYSIANRILRDSSEAEDIVQEIFLQVWRMPESFVVSEGGLSRWLAVVSRNRSIQTLRKRKPSTSTEDLFLVSSFNLAAHCELHLVAEKARLLMQELPLEHQRLLDMSFFQGLSHTEIATSLGYPMGTVKTRIRYALQSLRKSLRQQRTVGGLPPLSM